MTRRIRVAYPGSFDPPTIAHLEVARAAHHHLGDAEVHWIVSEVALGKESVRVPSLDDRIGVLEQVAAGVAWLSVVRTSARLIADIAVGYDAVVVGADKWRQIVDPAWYGGDPTARDASVASLPRALVVPRAGDRPDGVELLEVADEHHHVSSSDARAGRAELMLPAAAAFDRATGAWTDPARYRAGARP
jgi:nicotinic acid mononucleotide adenylyltransferase